MTYPFSNRRDNKLISGVVWYDSLLEFLRVVGTLSVRGGILKVFAYTVIDAT